MEDTLASQKICHKYEKFATTTSYFILLLKKGGV